MGTHRYFVDDPTGSWSWYLRGFEKVVGARPNPSHYALAALEACAMRAAKRARIVLFAGTSFAVGITAMVLEEALGSAASGYSIDPTPRPSAKAVRTIVAPAEVALRALHDGLAAAARE